MYRIIITPNYFQGTINAPQEGFLTDDDNDIIEFDTKEDAQKWINDVEEDVYCLDHGEASRPDYEIVDSDWTPGEDCYDATSICLSEHYKFGKLISPKDIPTNIKDILDRANVEYYESGNDYDVYSYEEQGYTIVFCPKTVSLQLYQDDLGQLSWGNEAYYYRED